MHLDSEKLDNGIIKVNLSGRMDFLGTQTIEKEFTDLIASQNAPVLVDLTDVEFLSSLAMRTLIFSSKDLAKRGWWMVLYRPRPNVREVLQASGVSSLIRIYHDIQDAMDALTRRQSE
ncbi:MAG: STAS domain-containing protein [Gammaproteobacteria bacterium]